jgi:dolichyl-phosphate beta-glucosyltransferase
LTTLLGTSTEKRPLPSPAYSIVLPAYNESERIAATIEKIFAFAAQQGWQVEIIVVDDGSSDDTAEVVRRCAATRPGVRLLQNPGNRGKGYSVRHGMLQAQGEILLFSDADLSSPIAEAEKLFAAIAAGADIAIGSRWLNTQLQLRRQPLYRQLLGRAFNLALRLILGLQFEDTQCGFKAFTRSAAQAVFPLQKIERWGFDPELLYLARRLHLRVAEVPVAWAHREGTRINPLLDGMRMLGEMLQIRWHGLRGVYRATPTLSRPL